MKKKINVARAWRDEDYYLSLTNEERASLGPHPAGAVTVADEVLRSISGGCGGTATKTPATGCYGPIVYCN